ILFAVVLGAMVPARAADSIKVGFSMALTGAVAPNGKQNLLALEIWRDDVNAKGGLLGRPVELVYYDDQSNPNNVPGIYTKLISVDKVDLLIGPYATNMIAPAMPVIMQAGKMTIGMLGVNVNRQFNYSRYFSMVPGGDEGTLAFSRGWFEIAAAQTPKPKTVALIAADAEFGRTACDGARENAKAGGVESSTTRGIPPPPRHSAHRAGHSGGQPGPRCLLRLSARYGGDRARGERDRLEHEDVRRGDDRSARHADQGAARPADEWLGHHGKFHPRADARFPGSQGDAGQISGQGAFARHRSLGLWVYALRLPRRPGDCASGRGDEKPRPRQARGLHPCPQILDRGRRNRIREGRRMDEVTAVLHPISARERERPRAVPRYHAPSDPVAAGI